MVLAERMSVKFLWVLAHKGIGGNEISDQVAKRASLHLFIGPEPSCGISDKSCEAGHQGLDVQRAPGTGQRHAKSILSKLTAKRTVQFFKAQQFPSKTYDRPVNRTLSLTRSPLQTGYN
jgi:hypothetical protein